MLLKISKAKHVAQYKIKLIFNDGLETEVDLKKKVHEDHREIFKALKDVEFFKTFELDRWTINWSNNLDLAPEYLYDLAKRQAELKTTNIM